jgi:hypothetical protein
MMHFQGSHFFPDTVSNYELRPKRFAEHGVCNIPNKLWSFKVLLTSVPHFLAWMVQK